MTGKMLGRLGWRGQCSCCNGPKPKKAIRAEEKVAVRVEIAAGGLGDTAFQWLREEIKRAGGNLGSSGPPVMS